MADETNESNELARLFQSARMDVPTADDERRLLEALCARLGAGDGGDGGGASSGAPAPRARLAVTRPVPVAGALAAGAALIVSLLYVRPPSAAPASSSTVVRATPRAMPSAPSPLEPMAQPRAEPLVQAPGQRAKAGAHLPTKPKSHRAQVPSEADLIERARRAVRRDPARALALTEQHKLSYRAGELSPEREVLAIEALARLGRRADALARADAFRASHPTSIHSARIEAVLHDQTKHPSQ